VLLRGEGETLEERKNLNVAFFSKYRRGRMGLGKKDPLIQWKKISKKKGRPPSQTSEEAWEKEGLLLLFSSEGDSTS